MVLALVNAYLNILVTPMKAVGPNALSTLIVHLIGHVSETNVWTLAQEHALRMPNVKLLIIYRPALVAKDTLAIHIDTVLCPLTSSVRISFVQSNSDQLIESYVLI